MAAKIEWVAVAHISPDRRFKVERITDRYEECMLYADGQFVRNFSSVGPAMRYAQHMADELKKAGAA